jgi:hypothetical protein
MRLLLLVAALVAQQAAAVPPLDLFFGAAQQDDRQSRPALEQLATQWRDSYTPLIIDLARLMRPAPRRVESDGLPGLADDDPTAPPGAERPNPAADIPAFVRRESVVRQRLLRFLEQQTKQRFGEDLNAWREWMWKLPDDPHPEYAAFKGALYAQIDPLMQRFFPPGATTTIRLDEVDWGGVKVNGIPPLYHPKHTSAREATYLRDNHIVFGVVVNGEARAYPKRILAWHEMALDRIGGVEMTIVYCTLCGTVIPYESVAGGRLHRFGTSGLLYRSNKLMFDEGTMSLWSTLDGQPVVGSLVGSGLQLTAHASVTTTWGEWRAQHPDTLVLSLDTGYERDYREGAAYRDYFSTDDLYFRVSNVDRRLKNKAEVLVFTITGADQERQPVAIAADFLKRNRVYELTHAGRRYVIVTSPQGANRVYDAATVAARFTRAAPGDQVLDDTGGRWRVTEEALSSEAGAALPRVAAQRAFWFGWYAQYPNTVLVK